MEQATRESTQLNLRLDGMGRLGEASAQHEGRQVFVFGGIPGEEVLAEIVRQYRGHITARAVEVRSASPQRVIAPCPYFGACTGCQWQHISYEHQLELKQGVVKETMAQEGGMPDAPVAPVVPAPQTLGYRNHARFTIGPEGSLGFVNRQSRRFIKIDCCLLMHSWINQALTQLQGHCSETTQLSIRYGVNTDDWLIQPTLSVPQTPASGQKHYQEALLGRRFRVSAASFFQVNSTQAEQMVLLVKERLDLTGRELVVDAYAGVGTFAVLLAPSAGRVVAIEESASAIEDAEFNIYGLSNIELVQAKTEGVLGSLPQAPDALVLDPPRTGCHPAVIRAINFYQPRRIVYVSCDPEALARDLRALCHGPFVLEEVLPIDLFPQTHHIECIATLSYNVKRQRTFQARQQLILASESPRRQDILAAMGITFEVVPPAVEETQPAFGDPVSVALNRAVQKARVVAAGVKQGAVVAADTIVIDGEDILGKPASEEVAYQFLCRLRGKQHRVITAIALIDVAGGEELTGYCTSRVYMREYSDEEIAAYVTSGSPLDKAGAYAIQDTQFHPVERVKGCYLNVVGLPVCTLLRLLYQIGVHPTLNPDWTPPGNCPDCSHWANLRPARQNKSNS